VEPLISDQGRRIDLCVLMQNFSRVIMTATEVKMQPTIHYLDVDNVQVNFANVLWVAFSIPSGSLYIYENN
jgi:hypothetical protein